MDKQNFICPITQQVFNDPVMADDGNLYEKDAIEQWYQTKKISPLTREKISDRFVTVKFMRSMISEYLEKNPDLKARQYLVLKDFYRNRDKVYEYIQENQFDKLLHYKDYKESRLLQKGMKMTIKEKTIELTCIKYVLKNCQDMSIIKHFIENVDDISTNTQLSLAEHASEEINMKYIDKSDYYRIKSEYNWNPLHFFVKRGFINIIEAIGNINTFKKFNIKTNRYYTPLMMALKYNHNVIDILLKYEMPVTFTDMQFAIENKISYEIIKKLYDHRNDKNKSLICVDVCQYGKYEGYMDFLKYVSENPSLATGFIGSLCKYAPDEIVKMFIDKGVSVNTMNKDGHSDWQKVLELHRFNIFRYMLPRIDFTLKTNRGSSMIHHLVISANYELMKEMTDKYEFNYNEIAYNKTPLLWALEQNYIKVCKLLMDKGADVNIQLNGDSHIMSALKQYPDNLDFLKFVFSKCNNFEIMKEGIYPIHYVGIHKTPEFIKYMIDLNINLESLTDANKKLIHILCERTDCDDLIKYLIEEKKVSVEDYDVDGYKPMHYMFMNGSFEMIDYMKKVTKDHKINKNDKELVDLLLKNKNVKNTVKALFEID